jgi:hypothetical protein
LCFLCPDGYRKKTHHYGRFGDLHVNPHQEPRSGNQKKDIRGARLCISVIVTGTRGNEFIFVEFCAGLLAIVSTSRVEYRLRLFDGEYRWLLDSGVPRFDAGGSFVGYIGSAFDVTQHKTEVTPAAHAS